MGSSLFRPYLYGTAVQVQYTNQSNSLKLLPVDSEALAQHGSGRGPTNTVMCMEYCDGGSSRVITHDAGSSRCCFRRIRPYGQDPCLRVLTSWLPVPLHPDMQAT